MDSAHNAIIAMITEAVRSNRWENENSPGSAHIKDIYEYEGAWKQLNELPDKAAREIFQDIANTIEWSMNDDWMPQEMFALPLCKARLFLRDILPIISEFGLQNSVQRIKECHAKYRENS
jgi:hypothetical protein